MTQFAGQELQKVLKKGERGQMDQSGVIGSYNTNISAGFRWVRGIVAK